MLIFIAAQAQATTSVRVLTYNVYAKPDPLESLFTEERMNKLCERLREGPWDIVMLQEVWTKNHRQRLSRCGYPHVMDLRATGSAKRERNLGSGLLILSRLPLEEQQRKILVRPAGIKAIVLHGEGLARKSVYLAKARLADGRSFWVANTHLVANYCITSDFSVCTSYQNVRLSQVKQAREFLWQKTAGETLIFGGDLNFGAHPTSHDRSWDEFATLFPGFQQAPHGPEISTSSETNSFKDDEGGKIDHIYVSPDLQARDGALVFTDMMTTRKGVQTHISDHYGWESTIDLP
jgi:endonuclease/exonuclease/phosphatase family metal-dependent hydrolase